MVPPTIGEFYSLKRQARYLLTASPVHLTASPVGSDAPVKFAPCHVKRAVASLR